MADLTRDTVEAIDGAITVSHFNDKPLVTVVWVTDFEEDLVTVSLDTSSPEGSAE